MPVKSNSYCSWFKRFKISAYDICYRNKKVSLFIDSQSKQKFYQNKKLRSYNPVIIEWEILQPMGFDHRKWLKSKLVMLRKWLKVCWIQCLRTLAISQDWATTFTSETTMSSQYQANSKILFPLQICLLTECASTLEHYFTSANLSLIHLKYSYNA